MRRAIHRRAKLATVKGRSVAPPLHAFHYENILFKDKFPLRRVLLAQRRVRIGSGVIEVNMFDRAIQALRLQDDGKGMIAVYTQKHIGIDRDIFCRLIPFGTEI